MARVPSRAGSFPTGPNNRSGIIWYDNPFQAGSAAQFVLALKRGLASKTTDFAKRVEQYAKDNAKWDDRTGDARSGLTALGQQRLSTYTITLFHTVDYGIWLEVRWAGKYAIILPTIQAMGPELMRELELADLIRRGT